MGAQVSTNTEKRKEATKEAILRGVSAQCGSSASSQQVMNIGSIGSDCMEFDSDEGKVACMELQNKRLKLCGPRNIKFTQDATVTATTYCSAAYKGISDSLSEMPNESETIRMGLGWGRRTSTNAKEKQIYDIVEASCRSEADMKKRVMVDSELTCGDLNLYQNVDLKAQCAVEAISAHIDENIEQLGGNKVGNKGKWWSVVFGTLFGTRHVRA